jgi:hypothetical protein
MVILLLLYTASVVRLLPDSPIISIYFSLQLPIPGLRDKAFNAASRCANRTVP